MEKPTFRMERSLIEATSLHRPDPSWIFTDAEGHVHQWFTEGKPAIGYSAIQSYSVPTTVWEKTGEEFYEDDDEPHDVGHYICRICKQEIQHGFCADTNTQYVPGITRFYIDDVSVSKEEYERRYREWSFNESRKRSTS